MCVTQDKVVPLYFDGIFVLYSFHRDCNTMSHVMPIMSESKKSDNSEGQQNTV